MSKIYKKSARDVWGFQTTVALLIVASFGLLEKKICAAALTHYSLPVDWYDVRASGMGDAVTTVAHGESAAFANPAGLARTRNAKKSFLNLDVPNVTFFANGSAYNVLGKDVFKPSQWLEKLGNYENISINDVHEIGVQTNTHFSLGLKDGIIAFVGFPTRSIYTTSAVAGSLGVPIVSYDSINTFGLSLGLASSTRGGGFSAGFFVRPNVVFHDWASGAATVSLSDIRKESEVSFGVPVDFGVVLAASDFWLPTFAVAVRNIPTGCLLYPEPNNPSVETMVCGTVRRILKNPRHMADTDSELDPTEIRTGISVTPRLHVFKGRLNIRFAADVFPVPIVTSRGDYGFRDVALNKLMHTGAEIFMGNPLQTQKTFAVRFGRTQEQMTYGFTFVFGETLIMEYACRNADDVANAVHIATLSTQW